MESMTSLLTQEQWDILDGMRSNLGLAADLAQAKISLILPLDAALRICGETVGQTKSESRRRHLLFKRLRPGRTPHPLGKHGTGRDDPGCR